MSAGWPLVTETKTALREWRLTGKMKQVRINPHPFRLPQLPWNWPQYFGVASSELRHVHCMNYILQVHAEVMSRGSQDAYKKQISLFNNENRPICFRDLVPCVATWIYRAYSLHGHISNPSIHDAYRKSGKYWHLHCKFEIHLAFIVAPFNNKVC
jgi:hypothetical protein